MPIKPELVHYWGWTPTGPGNRCGASTGPCTDCAPRATCPACLDALAEQLRGRLGDRP